MSIKNGWPKLFWSNLFLGQNLGSFHGEIMFVWAIMLKWCSKGKFIWLPKANEPKFLRKFMFLKANGFQTWLPTTNGPKTWLLEASGPKFSKQTWENHVYLLPRAIPCSSKGLGPFANSLRKNETSILFTSPWKTCPNLSFFLATKLKIETFVFQKHPTQCYN